MRFDPSVLDGNEQLVFALRSLYGRYGYTQYKMSKFEEYALYGRNIDFLVSDSVITFTDTDGKLMALKPDVTLSIVKNDRDDPRGVRKVCYNENVYRVSKGTGSFREIMQTGLECIGAVDNCMIGEVLSLAAKSLALTGRRFVLEVSHLGILDRALSAVSDDPLVRDAILKCVGEKNIHGVYAVCDEHGVDREKAAALTSILSTYGKPAEVIAALRGSDVDGDAVDELEAVLSVFDGGEFADRVGIDFSLTADPHYYNGIVFKGFVEGAPGSVLSGGQYDNLMKRMGLSSRAIGFAVYLEMLERLYEPAEQSFDVMLLYGDDTAPAALAAKSAEITAGGRTVFCCKEPDPKIICKETIRI